MANDNFGIIILLNFSLSLLHVGEYENLSPAEGSTAGQTSSCLSAYFQPFTPKNP
jgi:hypothetical protein